MNDDFIDRLGLAKFLVVSAGTLAVWESENRYDLPCEKSGKPVYYKWVDVYKFISFDQEDFDMLCTLKDRTPLLNAKMAAHYLETSRNTLRKWEADGAYGLRSRRAGQTIRYRLAELDDVKQKRFEELERLHEGMPPLLPT